MIQRESSATIGTVTGVFEGRDKTTVFLAMVGECTSGSHEKAAAIARAPSRPYSPAEVDLLRLPIQSDESDDQVQ